MKHDEIIVIRDRILNGLRSEFQHKVAAIIDAHLKSIPLEPFLTDIANNIAQGFAAEPSYRNIEGCALADHEVEE